jgi:hypothetical protein
MRAVARAFLIPLSVVASAALWFGWLSVLKPPTAIERYLDCRAQQTSAFQRELCVRFLP